MRARFGRYSATLRRIWQVLVLFAVLRLGMGLTLIIIAGRDDAAWSLRLTIIAALAAIVCFGSALAVRAWSPPRHP